MRTLIAVLQTEILPLRKKSVKTTFINKNVSCDQWTLCLNSSGRNFCTSSFFLAAPNQFGLWHGHQRAEFEPEDRLKA